MIKKVISSSALLFFVVTQITPMAHGEDRQWTPQSAPASSSRSYAKRQTLRERFLPSFRVKNLKKTALASCTALLASTTTLAVYTTKLLGTLPEPIFSMTIPGYRDRKVMHVFLARALGKKIAAHFDIEFVKGESALYAVGEPVNYEEKVKDAFSDWDEEDIDRSIIFTKSTDPNRLSGFILIPGFTARFDATFKDDTNLEFIAHEMTSDKVLMQGVFKVAPRPQL